MATASTDTRRTSGPITLYSVLDIPTDSDPETIRNAYRRLARLFHPDTGGDAHSMSLVNKAWAVLGDPDRRAAYDRRMGIEQEVKVSAGPPEPVEGSPLTSRMMTGTGTVLANLFLTVGQEGIGSSAGVSLLALPAGWDDLGWLSNDGASFSREQVRGKIQS